MAYYVHLLASKKQRTLHLGVTGYRAARIRTSHQSRASFAKRISSLHRGVDSWPAPSGASRNDDQLQFRITLRFVGATLAQTKTPASLPGFCIRELA
jgi:hypothetical protein